MYCIAQYIHIYRYILQINYICKYVWFLGKSSEDGKKLSISEDKEAGPAAPPAKEPLSAAAEPAKDTNAKVEPSGGGGGGANANKADHSKPEQPLHTSKHDGGGAGHGGGHNKYDGHSSGYGKYDGGYKHRGVGKSLSSGSGGRGGRGGGGGRRIERTDSAAKSPQGTKWRRLRFNEWITSDTYPALHRSGGGRCW